MFSENEPPTLTRLNFLLAAGYKIDPISSQNVGNVLWLDHPAEQRIDYPTLILSSDGFVVSSGPHNHNKEQLRISPDQELDFNHFLRTVPKPTLWERYSALRIGMSVGFIIYAIIPLSLLGLANVIWRAIK